MQTFLTATTADCFKQTAKSLDNKRLNKQALEAWQIMMTNLKLDPEGNHREPKGWYNHPAVKMWRGHESQLFLYTTAMTTEWMVRGFKTTIGDKAMSTLEVAYAKGLWQTDDRPEWMVDPQFFTTLVSSHRTALLVKNYEWYSQFGWNEDPGHQPEGYEYVWGQEV